MSLPDRKNNIYVAIVAYSLINVLKIDGILSTPIHLFY